MTPAELTAQHRRIGLDANVLIYLFEDDADRGRLAGQLIDGLAQPGRHGVLATIGLAEVLAGPARRGELAELTRGVDEIRSLDGLTIEPLTVEIAVDAAVIRGARLISLDDAVHLATARAAGATTFVTNDRRLRGAPHLDVVYLDDLTPDPTDPTEPTDPLGPTDPTEPTLPPRPTDPTDPLGPTA